MGAPRNTTLWWTRCNLYMQLRSMRMFGSRLEGKRPCPGGTSHLLGEQRVDPRPMLSQGLHWTHSFPPVEILSIDYSFHLQSRPKHLRKSLFTGLMMINACNVRANDVRESEASPATSVPETSPPAQPRRSSRQPECYRNCGRLFRT